MTTTQSDGKVTPVRPPVIDKYVDTFLSTVCDTSRRYILELLAQPYERIYQGIPERRSGDIARTLGLSTATTSEHLRQLAAANLVHSRREGNMVYYRLCNHVLVQAFQDLLVALDKHYNVHVDQD